MTRVSLVVAAFVELSYISLPLYGITRGQQVEHTKSSLNLQVTFLENYGLGIFGKNLLIYNGIFIYCTSV
jgi:hypothetical protein